MTFFEAIVLGLVQGLTEFLPISSSAHLRIVGELAAWGDPGATFTAITQLGTELAVIIYFRRQIGTIISKWFASLGARGGRRSTGIQKGDPDVRMGWLIIIATVPIVIAGFLLQDTIRTSFRSLWIVADRAHRLRRAARARRPARSPHEGPRPTSPTATAS